MSKFGDFFKNFGKNFGGDPMGTVKGIVQVAAGAGLIYLAATGKVPVGTAETVGPSLILSGIHSMGTDSTGTTTPAALQAEGLVTTAAELAPQILTVADHVKAVKAAGDDAAATLALISAVAPLLAPAAVPAPVAPVTVNIAAAPAPDAV